MSTTRPKVDLVTIDEARINDVIDSYFKWKDLNTFLRGYVSRGINMPDAISEPIGCYALDFLWNKGSAGDAETPDGRKVEFKATSNFNSDLTSFGPSCDFDLFVFLRFDLDNDLCYIYNTNMSHFDIERIKVNSYQTVRDQQLQGRRPHVRIIEEVIEPLGLKPTCVFDIRRCKCVSSF